MGLEIELLRDKTDAAYGDFFQAVPEHLFFASPRHLAYLRALLQGTEDLTLLALDQGRVLGALPCLALRHPLLGAVMNSLPYYGSNAGLMRLPEAPDGVVEALLDAWQDLARQRQAAAWTMVENPLTPQHRFMEKAGIRFLRDRRIGQLTPLARVRPNHVAEDLMALFHQKTRNMVRKAQKNGLLLERDESQAGLAALHALHTENMAAVGGRAKSWRAFEAIPRFFRPDRDYRLYLAKEAHGETVAGLLVFFCNHTAEYYTPAVKVSHRPLQPVSGLIFQAMREAVQEGMRWWNWGGTWLNQEGVYRFKSRWGAIDCPYTYYVSVRDLGLFDRSPDELQHAFPFFYVRPYSQMELPGEAAAAADTRIPDAFQNGS